MRHKPLNVLVNENPSVGERPKFGRQKTEFWSVNDRILVGKGPKDAWSPKDRIQRLNGLVGERPNRSPEERIICDEVASQSRL
jgi:hypothetical protein